MSDRVSDSLKKAREQIFSELAGMLSYERVVVTEPCPNCGVPVTIVAFLKKGGKT